MSAGNLPHQPWSPGSIARGDVRQALGVDGGVGKLPARGNALNWELWREVLGLQMLCGPRVRSTRVTSGDQTSRSREVAGHLEQLLRVIALVDATAGSQVIVPGLERDPTGLLALRGDVLLALAGEGLARLDGVLTTGGYRRSEFAPDGQAREVPAAIDYLARFASWRLEGDLGWAMPLRIGAKLVVANTPAGNAMGVGAFVVENEGATVRLVQREADRLVIREASATPAGRAALEQLAAVLNGLGDTQRAAIAKLFPVQQQAELQQKDGGAVLPETAALLARLEDELRRVNESLAALGAKVTGVHGGFTGFDELLSGGIVDATAGPQDGEVFEIWGSLDAYSLEQRKALDEALRGTDPELYQDEARLAPHFYVSLDKVIGDDKPPPKKKEDGDPPPPEDGDQDSKPQPPPGGGGGGKPKPNPQDPAIFADPSAGGVPDDDDLIGLPSLGIVASPTAEAFVTETGNAVNPHPITWSPDDEDLEDFAAGGKPDTDGGDDDKPASTPCPIDDPLFGTPGSVFGPPDDFSTGGNPLDGLPFFPLPDVGTL